MGNNLLSQNPFAVLTFIVAPAILTNATSMLAMSTINRMLRTRESMHQLYTASENSAIVRDADLLFQVNRVEKQASSSSPPSAGFTSPLAPSPRPALSRSSVPWPLSSAIKPS
jgi:hypothetical protein